VVVSVVLVAAVPVTISAAALTADTTADATATNGDTVTVAAAAAPVLANPAALTGTSTAFAGRRSRRGGGSGLAVTPPRSCTSGGSQGSPLCRWWATAKFQGDGKGRGMIRQKRASSGSPLYSLNLKFWPLHALDT